MRTTIDAAGRLVIPKALRDGVGLGAGEVELVVDGTGIRIELLAADDLLEEDDRLVIPAAGAALDDEAVRTLGEAGQR